MIHGHNNPERFAAALHLLGKLKSPSYLGLVVKRLDDNEWFVRAAACRALTMIPCDASAAEALRQKLGDEHWWVRSNAARALASQAQVGKKPLLESLDSDDRYARHAAMWALSNVKLTRAEFAAVDDHLHQWETEEVEDGDISLFQARLAREAS